MILYSISICYHNNISHCLIVNDKEILEAGVDYAEEERAAAFEFPRIRTSSRLTRQPPNADERERTEKEKFSSADQSADQFSLDGLIVTDDHIREQSRNHRSQGRADILRHPRRSSVNHQQSINYNQNGNNQQINQLPLSSTLSPLSLAQSNQGAPYLQPPPTTESQIDEQFQNWIPVPWIKLLSEASFRRTNPPPIEFEMFRPPPPMKQNRIDLNQVNYGPSDQEINRRNGYNQQNAEQSCTCSPGQRYGQRISGNNLDDQDIELNYKSLDDVLAEVIDESGYDNGGHGNNGNSERPLLTPTYDYEDQNSRQFTNNGNSNNNQGRNEEKMIYKGYVIDNEESLAMICRQFTNLGGNKYVSPPPPPPKSFLSPASNVQSKAGGQQQGGGYSVGQQPSAGYLTPGQNRQTKNYQSTPTKSPKLTTIDYAVTVSHPPPTQSIKWSVTGQQPINPYSSSRWKNQTLNNGIKGINSGIKLYNQQNNNVKTKLMKINPVVKSPTIKPTTENYLNNHRQEQEQLTNPVTSSVTIYGQEQQEKYWNDQRAVSKASGTEKSTTPYVQSESYHSTHPVQQLQSTTTQRWPQQYTMYTSPSSNYPSSTPRSVNTGHGIKGGRRSVTAAVPFYNSKKPNGTKS